MAMKTYYSIFSPPNFDNTAQTIVDEGFTQAQEYASNAFITATGFLTQLTELSESLANLPTVDVNLTPPNTAIDAIVLPDAPAEPDTTISLVEAPAEPSYTMPTDPTLLNINVPGDPSIDLPAWTAEAPVGPEHISTTIDFVEPAYVSTLLSNMQTVLVDWVNGDSTGLAPDVEQAIWDRARSREDKIADSKLTEISRTFSGRGFPMPPGAMQQAMLAAIQEKQDKSSSLSRDIAIKQAELEQTNRHFAFQQGVQLEAQLLNYANAVVQRAYEYARDAAQLILSVYQGDISKFQADVQAYGVEAQALDSLTRRALAPLEVYKGQIEGQKLISELNTQNTEVYKAKLEAVKIVEEIYKTGIEAWATGVTAELDRVKTLGAVYDSTTKGYAAKVDAETTKVKTQAEVYKAESDVAVSQATLSVEAVKANLQLLIQKANLIMEAVKGGSQVAAQLAASALSSVNLSAQVGAHESKQLDTSYRMSDSSNRSTQYSELHSYKHADQ